MAGLQFQKRRQEDPVFRAWSQVQVTLERSGRQIGVAVLVLLVGVAAVVYWQRSRVSREAEASVKLAEARGAYWRGDYGTVLQQARDIESQYGGTRSGAEATRVKGDALYWQGDFKGAIAAYEEYLRKVKTASPAFTQVRENLAQSLENDGQFERAAELYEEIAAAESPRDIQAARWLGAGRAWRLAGNGERSLAAYRRVIEQFADTPSARSAQMLLGEAGILDS